MVAVKLTYRDQWFHLVIHDEYCLGTCLLSIVRLLGEVTASALDERDGHSCRVEFAVRRCVIACVLRAHFGARPAFVITVVEHLHIHAKTTRHQYRMQQWRNRGNTQITKIESCDRNTHTHTYTVSILSISRPLCRFVTIYIYMISHIVSLCIQHTVVLSPSIFSSSSSFLSDSIHTMRTCPASTRP